MTSVFSSIKQGLTEALEYSEGKLKKAVVHEFKPVDIKKIRSESGLFKSEFGSLNPTKSLPKS